MEVEYVACRQKAKHFFGKTATMSLYVISEGRDTRKEVQMICIDVAAQQHGSPNGERIEGLGVRYD